MKSFLEVDTMYKKINYSNMLEKDVEFNLINYNNGLLETLEMIMESLNMHNEEVTSEIMQEYKSYLEDRHIRDVDVYGEDITLGWLKGSIKAVEWYLDSNVIDNNENKKTN